VNDRVALRLIAHRHPAATQNSAHPTLTYPKRSLEMGGGISLGSERHHFFRGGPSAPSCPAWHGQQLLEPGILVLERLQLLGLADIHAAKLGLRQPERPPRAPSIPMICSSVNLLRFISGPFSAARAYLKLD
jgi:hypothetical protein